MAGDPMLAVLDWEREALAAGEDPGFVHRRREVQERLHDRADALLAAADDQVQTLGIALEGREAGERIASDELLAAFAAFLGAVSAAFKLIEGEAR